MRSSNAENASFCAIAAGCGAGAGEAAGACCTGVGAGLPPLNPPKVSEVEDEDAVVPPKSPKSPKESSVSWACTCTCAWFCWFWAGEGTGGGICIFMPEGGASAGILGLRSVCVGARLAGLLPNGSNACCCWGGAGAGEGDPKGSKLSFAAGASVGDGAAPNGSKAAGGACVCVGVGSAKGSNAAALALMDVALPSAGAAANGSKALALAVGA